ncbi:MAG: DEAD/DEAH box helicase [Coriobacteriia bacterium]|nr:DEAD/DEAH box helicase [Coriobacteriia bacterium]
MTAHGLLADFGRLSEAGVSFTYREGDLFVSAFTAAIQGAQAGSYLEDKGTALMLARTLEEFVTHPALTVSPLTASLAAGTMYWLADHSANACVVGRQVTGPAHSEGVAPPVLLLHDLLTRNPELLSRSDGITVALRDYLLGGGAENIAAALRASRDAKRESLKSGDPSSYVASVMMASVLEALKRSSLWAFVDSDYTSAGHEAWADYCRAQLDAGRPLIDLWPSQQRAVEAGLLDGKSSLVLQMPTSAGKTRVAELAIWNDLKSDSSAKALYVAPFRALVGEVEQEIGARLSALGIPVASLYGGSEANELDVLLTSSARLVVATPEKAAAVARGGALPMERFSLVVLDEGHLLDSLSRGARYEFQLAGLLRAVGGEQRTLFLSAVLPNADVIAGWLAGGADALAKSGWSPSQTRVWSLTWSKDRDARLDRWVNGKPSSLFVPRFFGYRDAGTRGGVPSREALEVAVATGVRFAHRGPVLVYTNRPDWAESGSRKFVDAVKAKRISTEALVDDANRDSLEALAEYAEMILGGEAPLAAAIRHGVAYHHGRLPQPLRLAIEHAYRQRQLRLLIVTSTLAQGVNLPAKAVIVHSLPISAAAVRDFWNLAGRAGRGMEDTVGDVVVLTLTSAAERRLPRMLNKANIEPVHSVVLSLVTHLLEIGGDVSASTLAVLLEQSPEWLDTVQAVDSALLEYCAEDWETRVAGELDEFVSSLFAAHESANQPEASEALQAFCRSRKLSVVARVDSGVAQKIVRMGLSVGSGLSIVDAGPDLLDLAEHEPEASESALTKLLETLPDVAEWTDDNRPLVASIAWTWMSTGSYKAVYDLDQSFFRQDVGHAVEYITNTVGYRLAWVLSGALVSLEDADGSMAHVPDWIRSLPAMLFYGVNSRALVWAMSLGLSDRRVAEDVLGQYSAGVGRGPQTFRELADWILGNQEAIIAAVTDNWPSYFGWALSGALKRYATLRIGDSVEW